MHKVQNHFEKIFIKIMHIKYEIFMKKQNIFMNNRHFVQADVMISMV